MKNILYLLSFICLLSSCTEPQTEAEQIIEICDSLIKKGKKVDVLNEKYMQKLAQNIAVSEYEKASDDFSQELYAEFLPAFPKIKHLICDENNEEVLKKFMEVLCKNRGSADEQFADISGDVYRCAPDRVLKFVSQHKEYRFLIREIDFGVHNYSFRNKGEPGLEALQAKLDSMNEVRPFRDDVIPEN